MDQQILEQLRLMNASLQFLIDELKYQFDTIHRDLEDVKANTHNLKK